jgi:uncharacterized membrane protein YcaP (DUF421 family)
VESVIRATIIFFSLLVLFRVTGKRSLAQITPFDFIILLVIGDTVQDAILGDDLSITNSIVVIVTLFSLELVLSLIKQKSKWAALLIEDAPLIVVENGKPLKKQMDKERIDEEDILEAARESGLERMSQIKYAVLERDGKLSIIPIEDKEAGGSNDGDTV